MRLIALLAIVACSTGPTEPEDFELGGYNPKALLIEAALINSEEPTFKEPTSEWMKPDKIKLITYDILNESVATFEYKACPEGLEEYLEKQMVFRKETKYGARTYDPGLLAASNTWKLTLRPFETGACHVDVAVQK